jgi:hypothetical protein
VTELLAEIEQGSFDGMALWRRFHELKAAGSTDLLSTLQEEFADQLTPPE